MLVRTRCYLGIQLHQFTSLGLSQKSLVGWEHDQSVLLTLQQHPEEL
jgi:hypothetical protein